MIWVFPVIAALLITIVKEIFKKKLLVSLQPIQFFIIFTAFMFIYAQFTIAKVSIPSQSEFQIIAIAAFCYAVANLLGLKVLKQIEISAFNPIWALSSVMILFSSVFFLGETINTIQLVGISLVLIPILYLAAVEYKDHEFNIPTLLFLIASMLFATVAITLDRIALRTLNTFTYFYFLKLFILIVLIIAMFTFFRFKINHKLIKRNLRPIAILAFITTVGALLYFFALKDPLANTAIVRSILATSLIFTTIVGGLYFKEKHIAIKSAVAATALAGIIILVLN